MLGKVKVARYSYVQTCIANDFLLGKIHTNINEYSQYLEQDKEHVIAAIPEYEVQCGGSFDKPVEVVIPHCLNVDSKEKITVRYGSEEDLRASLILFSSNEN